MTASKATRGSIPSDGKKFFCQKEKDLTEPKIETQKSATLKADSHKLSLMHAAVAEVCGMEK